MSAQESSETVTEVWRHWEGAVVNGAYPLRRILHGSDHSAVFLTEYTAQESFAAAIKIIPAERVTLAQLAHWRMAATLAHPHLVRLLDAGLYQLGARQFLFVVMEYAEQTLAQVLPQRPLSCDEVREMLPAVLDALAFLHRRNLVQGRLKPTNFLVVNDQLKLASDTVRPAGEPRASLAPASLYDPPEARNGAFSPAGDIWGLGITLVEALTQGLPWPDESSATTSLPPGLPAAFADTIRRCLDHDPARRPTATELQGRLTAAPEPPAAQAPPPPVRAAPARTVTSAQPAARAARVLRFAAPALLLLLLAAWAVLRVFHGHRGSAPPAAGAAHTPLPSAARAPAVAAQSAGTPAPSKVSAAPLRARPEEPRPPPAPPGAPRSARPAPPVTDASPSVVHEQMPVVARSALRTIHGHVKVAVLVRVDASGNVTEARLENPGPSSYFARAAREAAGQWKFLAADGQDSRQWLLRFEFSNSGATGHATAR